MVLMNIKGQASVVQDAIATSLRVELARRAMTQVQISRETGISPVVLSRYFKGEREIPSSTLFAITRAIGISPDVVWDAANAALDLTESESDASSENGSAETA